MASVSTGAAIGRPELMNLLLRTMDRPAREALALAQRPLVATLTPALLGLVLVAATSALASLSLHWSVRWVGRFDALHALAEALLVVIPGMFVFSIYLRLRASARVLMAAMAISLLTAGLVTACVMPLMVFLMLVARDAPTIFFMPALLIPSLALATLASMSVRIITTLDGSRAAWWMARGASVLLGAVFFVRLYSLIRELLLF